MKLVSITGMFSAVIRVTCPSVLHLIVFMAFDSWWCGCMIPMFKTDLLLIRRVSTLGGSPRGVAYDFAPNSINNQFGCITWL